MNCFNVPSLYRLPDVCFVQPLEALYNKHSFFSRNLDFSWLLYLHELETEDCSTHLIFFLLLPADTV